MGALLFAPNAAWTSDVPGDGDYVEFQSDQFVSKFWKKRNPGKEFEFTQLEAKIRIPEGDGPFPAVVLLHGCGGYFDNIEKWASWFRDRGFVSVAPNSFHPRGVHSTCDDFNKVNQTERVADTYGALKHLESLPFVDKNRFIVMGFSNGGVTSLTSVQEAQAHKLNSITGKIVASIGIYPGCKVATPPFFTPLLVIVGEKDEWAPPIHCERFLKMRNNHPIELKIYPGVHHNFDYDNLDVTKYGKRSVSDVDAYERAKKDVAAFLSTYVN